MKLYHVQIEQEDHWYVGRVLERDGITTQGRSFDELIYMVRDAIHMMWNEKNVELEFVVSGNIETSFDKKAARAAGRRPDRRGARKVKAHVA